MKRPLCPLFLGLLAAVSLFLHLFPSKTYQDDLPADGDFITITGKVSSKEEDVFYLTPDRARGYQIQVYLRDDQKMPAIGETVRIRGCVRRFSKAANPGEFDAAQYYRMRGVLCRMMKTEIIEITGHVSAGKEALYRIRRYCSDVLKRTMSEEDAGMMQAVLLGDKQAMDADLKTLYRVSGVLHLACISGLHCTALGTGLYALLKRLRLKRLAAVSISILFMLAYGEMCGMPTSAVRAIFMFALMILAPVLGRTYDMLSACALIGILMLLEQPLYATDGGFLLSFGSIMALGILLPGLFPKKEASPPQKVRTRTGIRGKVSETVKTGLSASVAVALATLPVYMNVYYSFPVYSLFLNVIMIPLMGIVMPAGVLTVITGALYTPFGRLTGTLNHLILWLYRTLCLTQRTLPGHTWYAGAAGALQIALYYLCLVGALIVSGRLSGSERNIRIRSKTILYRLQIRPRAVKAALLLTGVLVLSLRTQDPLMITFVDVGQGDGIVIRQHDAVFLIDGGSSSVSSVGTYRLLPYLTHEGIGKIDAVFISHEDEDHLSGIVEIMEQTLSGGMRIGMIFLPEVAQEKKTANYLEFEHLAKECDIPVRYLSAGQTFSARTLVFTCLGPVKDEAAYHADNANAHSMILHLKSGAFTALFTGDVEEEGLQELNTYLAALPEEMRTLSVLKVAHHGSRLTTDEVFLSLIDARLSIISCGLNNRYGHPHAELLDRLHADGTTILTTAEHGAITIRVNSGGTRMEVETFLP